MLNKIAMAGIVVVSGFILKLCNNVKLVIAWPDTLFGYFTGTLILFLDYSRILLNNC